MHRVPPLDLHGSNIDGATNPLRLSRGDPRGGASRGGGWTEAAVPAAGVPPPRALGDSGAWAAAVAEAEAETRPVVTGPVPGEPTGDPSSWLSRGELSHEMLQTLMHMQGSHEAARERRRVRTASTDGDASAAYFPPVPRPAAQPEATPRTTVEAPAEWRASQSEEIRRPADRPPLRYAADPTPTSTHEALASFPGLSLQSMEAQQSSSEDSEDSDAGCTSD